MSRLLNPVYETPFIKTRLLNPVYKTRFINLETVENLMFFCTQVAVSAFLQENLSETERQRVRLSMNFSFFFIFWLYNLNFNSRCLNRFITLFRYQYVFLVF